MVHPVTARCAPRPRATSSITSPPTQAPQATPSSPLFASPPLAPVFTTPGPKQDVTDRARTRAASLAANAAITIAIAIRLALSIPRADPIGHHAAIATPAAATATNDLGRPQVFARPRPIRAKLTLTSSSTTFLTRLAQRPSRRPPPTTAIPAAVPAALSIPRTLHLHQRVSRWGRGAGNTHVYAIDAEVLIPRYSFEVIFWRPGLGRLLRSGLVKHWSLVPDVPAIIVARATRGLWVNGVWLPPVVTQSSSTAATRPDHEAQPKPPTTTTTAAPPVTSFGRLYTGDVITVWEDPDVKTKPIDFVCEFLWGASACRRPLAPDGRPNVFQIESCAGRRE
ncbi:MAG: hypothetical protein M1826_002494 [Phylliscum demangeonii]|nr:MAG: hypothetical protein M1826_002494 [Phylliscum demangeonii]